MKLSASFLSVKENLKENIERLDNSNIDYLHLDIMDGIFVPNKTWNIEQMQQLLQNTHKPKDVHLMVEDVISYIDMFSKLHPEFITFHLEAVDNVQMIIDYIKEKKSKVGISIKPNTNIDKLNKYLNNIDLILIMSVEPGLGGQLFIKESTDKIFQLNALREQNNYHFLIEVDGGINNETIKLCQNSDMVVVGSYITNGDIYNDQIDKLNLN